MLNKSNYLFKGLIVALLLLIGISYSTVVEAKITKKPKKTETKQPKQEFQNDSQALAAKVGAFATNAESFKKFVANVEPSNIDDERKHMLKMIESMLENNGSLQELTKKIALKQPTDKQKNFYKRSILPNLHNINRQLMRIKDSVDKDNINYKNLKWQSERVEESIKQVVDRLKSNAEQ